MERQKLEAQSRTKAGTGLGKMRRAGFVPGVVYGKKREAQTIIQVSLKDLDKAVRTEAGFNAIFELQIDGKEEGLVRIREYQAHPLKRVFSHVDFQTVDLTTRIEVEVPIQIIGKAEGLKEGGVLEQQRRSLILKCLVTQIPDHIEIDVTLLKIGQSVHADEIQLPEGVEFPHETNFVIVAVVPPTKEEAAVAPTAEVAAAVEGTAVEGATLVGEEGKESSKKEGSKKEEKK